MSERRYAYIDVLYSIGILLVILGHSHSSDWSTFEGTVLESLIDFIYTFHMPLFFFIAGFLFIDSKSFQYLGYTTWIKKKAIKLLTPYITLSVLALIPKYYFENHSMVTMEYLLEALLKPRVGVWGHFWFIPVLLLCYILFGVWRQMITARNKGYMLAIVVAVSIILYFLPFSTQWLGFDDLKQACVFVSLGMVLKQIQPIGDVKSKWIRCIWIMAAVLVTMLLKKKWNGISIVMLITAVLMISACWQLAKLIGYSSVAQWIGKHNFTIYIYSWPFQAIMMVICGRIGMPWFFVTPVMFYAGIGGPVILINIYEKLDGIQNHIFDLILGIK